MNASLGTERKGAGSGRGQRYTTATLALPVESGGWPSLLWFTDSCMHGSTVTNPYPSTTFAATRRVLTRGTFNLSRPASTISVAKGQPRTMLGRLTASRGILCTARTSTWTAIAAVAGNACASVTASGTRNRTVRHQPARASVGPTANTATRRHRRIPTTARTAAPNVGCAIGSERRDGARKTDA